ncbi:MAG: hypothetical protein JRI96_05385 [Deltaproteobacteria bacterium]|nr:hypothetical protein [Deltaproteobacteria bacterium]
MYIDNELLKKWYFEERKCLESLPLFKRESAMAIAIVKKAVLDRVSELRAQDLPDKFAIPHLWDFIRQKNVKSNINRYFNDFLQRDNLKVAEEMNSIPKIDTSKTKSNADDRQYAAYFYQLEKVNKIEVELRKRNLDPEEVHKALGKCGSKPR